GLSNNRNVSLRAGRVAAATSGGNVVRFIYLRIRRRSRRRRRRRSRSRSRRRRRSRRRSRCRLGGLAQ
ncbi:MAG: hypothetical protein ACRCWC_02385, partial [Plesiomonas shigelloides]